MFFFPEKGRVMGILSGFQWGGGKHTNVSIEPEKELEAWNETEGKEKQCFFRATA
jgi:hypothetical protein